MQNKTKSLDNFFEQLSTEQKQDFVTNFHQMTLSESLAYYKNLLLRSSDQNRDSFDQQYATYELKCINESMGLEYVKYSAIPFSKEERLIIRMDYYGTIDRIEPGEKKKKLSRFYLRGLKEPLKVPLPVSRYNFKKSPSWQLYARFEDFRRIERRLKQYMAQNRLNPQMLEIMTPRDFSDLIVQAFAKSPKENKVTFQYPISTRKRFIKKLLQKHHKEIYKILASKYDERWAFSMVQMMRRYGSTTQNKLVITEMYWTPRIINDLKAQHINTESFQVGARIPKRVLDSAFDVGLEKYFVARDAAGIPLRSSSFPSFEVHHKHPVCMVGELTDIQRANYEDNLCLVLSDIHSQILHGKDTLAGAKFYDSRIQFIDKNTAFMGGLNLEDQISVDFSQDPQIIERLEEDRKHACSFDVCMKELSDNGAACPKFYRKLRLQKIGAKTGENGVSRSVKQHDCTPKHAPKVNRCSKLFSKLMAERKKSIKGFD